MKIALVQPKFAQSGGAERYGLLLADGLSDRGHEIHLFARKLPQKSSKFVCHHVPALPFGRALKTWSFARTAQFVIPKNNYDVVCGMGKSFCQSVHRTGGGLHHAYLERKGRTRLTRNDKAVMAIEERLFKSRDLKAVICPSFWVAKEVQRFFPKAAPRIHIIPNGVDTKVFSPHGRKRDRKILLHRLNLPPTAKLLLFVAHNFELKGLDIAIAMFCRHANHHLVVIGKDKPGKYLQSAIKAGCPDRLHFMGPQIDMGPFYRAADLLLHPTRYDPFANVCLESMACGTPVITSDQNGVADVIVNGTCGAVITLDKMVAKAQAFFLDRSKTDQMARERARRLALDNNQNNHIARIESLFLDLTRRSLNG
jgi:UDP-glucose:(heptosyl)LPS alpha-1,3-glucosyltransferase